MKIKPASKEDAGDEISELVGRLLETEQRLRELTVGQVDSILDPTGRSYLLREAQDKLRESEERFRSMFNAAATGIAVSTPDGRFLEANAAYCRMLGYTENELRTRNFASLTHPEDLASNLKLRDELLAGRQESFAMEKRYLKKNGDIVWARPSVSSVRGANGKIARFIVVTEDITDRKRIEARFRRLVGSNAQGVFFWNKNGEITDANDGFLKLMQYTREDLEAGRINWAAMTPPEYAHLDRLALEQIAANGNCVPYEKEYIRKHGSRVFVLLGAANFEDNLAEGVCFVLDLTERKKLETQFRQSQKMEAIGQLAGGVAHDFNNILGVIQGYHDLLKTDGNLSATQLDYTEQIGAATRRAAALTRQLLLFSRKETMQVRDLDLNQSINDVTKLLRRTLGETVQLQFKFAMQDLIVSADAGMIDQVLINLAVNSRDAMSKGGRLVIETSAVDFDESVREQSAQACPGSFACLSVSDTGCGISPGDLPRIFEPFFTTKDVGKGTGLGLATVFGIVQQHKGWIHVYSEVGRGTTVRIYLPRLAKASKKGTDQALPASPRGSNETILLVEDDVFLCASVRKTLSQLGYRVLEASNGIAALEIWKKHRNEILLLLTDLVMPGGINGKDLGEQLLKENPKLKVIYASGYSAEIAAKNFPLEEGVNFLTKPVQAHKLAQTVRQMLDARITS